MVFWLTIESSTNNDQQNKQYYDQRKVADPTVMVLRNYLSTAVATTATASEERH